MSRGVVTGSTGRGMGRAVVAAWAAAALAWLWLGATPAGAQTKLRMDVEAGWGLPVPAERWSPLRITLEAPRENTGGVLVISHVQDASQNVRLVKPVTLTAGKPGVIEAVVCLPVACPRLVAEFIDDRGRRRARVVMARDAQADRGELPLVVADSSDDVHLAFVETAVPPDWAFPVWTRERFGEERSWTRVGTLRRTRLSVDALPTLPAAYESVDVLVTPGSAVARMDPGALTAVRHWLAGGGRLVVVADTPENIAGLLGVASLVRLGEPEAGSPPGDAAAGVIEQLERVLQQPVADGERAVRTPRGSDDESAGLAAEAYSSARGALMGRGVVSSLPQRRLILTEAGRGHGWVVRWGGAGEAGTRDGGLWASGPVGMGMLTVVGMDPTRLLRPEEGQVREAELSRAAAWAIALQPVLDGLATGTLETDRMATWGAAVSGASRHEHAALRRMLEEIADVPRLGHEVAVALGVSMLGLGLLLGPVDFLVLGRLKRRHQSWATALGWIALATGAGYVVPMLVRGGTTTVTRAEVIDVLLEAPTGPTGPARPGGAGAAGVPAPSLAFASGVTAVWAGQPLETPLTARRGREGAGGADGDGAGDARDAGDAGDVGVPGVWRGIAAGRYSIYAEPGSTLPTLTLRQRSAPLRPTGGAWGAMEAADEPGVTPTEGGLDLARWTLRCFLDERRATTALRARVSRAREPAARGGSGGAESAEGEGEGEGARAGVAEGLGWRVRVWGLGPGERVVEWRLRVKDGAAGAVPRHLHAAGAGSSGAGGTEGVDAFIAGDAADVGSLLPAHAAQLSGPHGREAAMAARVATGAWAVVELRVERSASGVGFSQVAARERQVTFARLVVPIEGAEGETGR